MLPHNMNGLFVRKALFGLGLLSLFAINAQAADLNICAGENEMPFSNASGEGFENEIGTLLGKALNRKVQFVYWKDPRYAVRDFLDKSKCDLMLGMDVGDPRILATKPYYKSGYVFITRRDRDIEATSWNDEILKDKRVRIGTLPDSPGKVMLLQIDRFDDMFDYLTELTNFQSTRNRYIRIEPSKIVNDVAEKHLHVGVLWGPEAGRYVRDAKAPLVMRLIKDDAKKSNGEKVPMQYEVVVGVRKGDGALKAALDKAIDEKQEEIRAILKKEGVPVL